MPILVKTNPETPIAPPTDVPPVKTEGDAAPTTTAPAAAETPKYNLETLRAAYNAMGIRGYNQLKNLSPEQIAKVRKIMRDQFRASPDGFKGYGTYDKDSQSINVMKLIPAVLPEEGQWGMNGTGLDKTTPEPFALPKNWYSEGGFMPLSEDASLVVGKTHEQGGEHIGNNVVEKNEVLVKDGDKVNVYSDRLGYSDEAKRLAEEKGRLEEKMKGIDESLDNLFKEQEESKMFADGGSFPSPQLDNQSEDYPLNGSTEEQNAWLEKYYQGLNNTSQKTAQPPTPQPEVQNTAKAVQKPEVQNTAPEIQKPLTYQERLLNLVEDLKPNPNPIDERRLRRAIKNQALADMVKNLGDSVFGSKGAIIPTREPGITSSVKALEDYYKNLAAQGQTYTNAKLGLYGKLYADDQAAQGLAAKQAFDEDQNKEKLDNANKIAADRNKTAKQIAAERNKTAKQIADEKKKQDKKETTYPILVDGQRVNLTADQVSDATAKWLYKYRQQLLKNPEKFDSNYTGTIKALLESGTLNNTQAQLAFLNQYGKNDPEDKAVIKSYAGINQPKTNKPTNSQSQQGGLFDLPGSNQQFVPGDLSDPNQQLDENMFDDIFQ